MAGAGEGAHFPLSNPTPQLPFGTFTRVLKLAECPNVYIKMTGLNELARRPSALPETYSERFYDDPVSSKNQFGQPGVPPFLRMAINAFGANRIMWGSDFPPVAGREGYRNALSGVVDDPALTVEEVEWIAGKTAQQVFKPPSGQIEVTTIALADWARGPVTAQDRADLVRCQQVGAMAFHANPSRTKPTLEYEPGVPQYHFDESRDKVPTAITESAVEKTFASWAEDPGWGQEPPLGWTGQRNHWWHIGRVNGLVVATAKTCEVTITHSGTGEQEVLLALTGVAVDPRGGNQGKGYGCAVVSAALARADASRRTMLFQTGDALGLYQRLGCAEVDHSLTTNSAENNPEGKRPFVDYHCVIYPPGALPSVPLELHGGGW